MDFLVLINCVVLLYKMTSEENQHRRQRNQNYRKPDNAPSKPNDALGLNLGILGKTYLKGCHRKLKRVATWCGISEEPTNLVNRSGQKPRLSFFLAEIGSFFRRFSFGKHKSKNAAKPPNIAVGRNDAV